MKQLKLSEICDSGATVPALEQINDCEFRVDGQLFSVDMDERGALDIWFHQSAFATPMLIGEAQFSLQSGVYNWCPVSKTFALGVPWEAAGEAIKKALRGA